MKRIRTWQSALDALIRERLHRSFAWGTQDCCMFAVDCVLAETGEDIAVGIRGTYSDANGALAVLDQYGGVEALGDARLGVVVSVAAAQVGDVLMIRQDGRDALAICAGPHLLAAGKDGLVTVPKSMALKAWRCTKS